jgi:hypothetical protein
MFVIPPFALMQKVEPKNQGKPKWLRLFCRPTHGNSLYSTHLFLTSFQEACFFSLTTFSKPHAFPLDVIACRRLIPLPFS